MTPRSRLLSVGIGLRGAESHTYVVPVFSKEAFYKLRLPERFFEYGGYWRMVTVKVLSTNKLTGLERPAATGRAYVLLAGSIGTSGEASTTSQDTPRSNSRYSLRRN